MVAARKWSADIRVFANISAVIKEQTIVHVETRYFFKKCFFIYLEGDDKFLQKHIHIVLEETEMSK